MGQETRDTRGFQSEQPPCTDDANDQEKEKIYRDYIKNLEEHRQAEHKTYLEKLTYISGGGLSLSLVKIKDFLGENFFAGYLLPVFWLFFGLSLVSIMAASLFAIYETESRRKCVDEFYSEGKNIGDAKSDQLLANLVNICNALSLVFILLGIFAMAIFVFVNTTT